MQRDDGQYGRTKRRGLKKIAASPRAPQASYEPANPAELFLLQSTSSKFKAK